MCERWRAGWATMSRTLLLLLATNVLIAVMCGGSLNAVRAHEMRPKNNLQQSASNNSGICGSIDIRNKPQLPNDLSGCRVVEGFVQILLFDSVNDSQLAEYSFPDLIEITEFLLLYRVNGLVSVGQLFPNLMVIRGREKVFGYSFVLYEMSSIQSIGLYSLTDIMSGSVRIDKNPSLCYANTIDWDHICHEKGEHFIKNLKPDNECALCPNYTDKPSDGEITTMPRTSSLSPSTIRNTRCPVGTVPPYDRPLCWDRTHCQRVCPERCGRRACNNAGECCSDRCLGSCAIGDPNHCSVCRNITITDGGGGGGGVVGGNRSCVGSCPAGELEYLGRRCVTRLQCINFPRPPIFDNKIRHANPYLVYENTSCVHQCPPNYVADYKEHVCKRCQGTCRKVCQSANIDSIDSARQLRGCTIINGSLEIQIRGGNNVATALEENLSMIEEVRGYIKIVRSYPLVTLSFFRKLRVIHGEYLDNSKYVFIALDNQNLQEIWDWNNRTLEIKQGRFFFHFNPKLCLEKIWDLQKKTNLSNASQLEVATNSNGDKIACKVTELDVKITRRSSRAMLLTWKAFPIADARKLLGYVVYSIEAPHKNITMYDGRDACGGDGWRLDDVSVSSGPELHYLLTQLRPYTQYAFYVKTYTIATETSGAQSNISYNVTLPGEPSEPSHLSVISNSSDSLTITWSPPLSPHGNVTHYVITGERDLSSRKALLERNACDERERKSEKVDKYTPQSTQKTPINNSSCVCEKKPGKKEDESERESQIKFEDQLYNFVYIKKDSSVSSRKKRDVNDEQLFPPDTSYQERRNVTVVRNVTERDSELFISFNFTVYGATSLYVNRLHHYTKYTINVYACREREDSESGEEDPDRERTSLCSDKKTRSQYTNAKEGVDSIIKMRKINQTADEAHIAWDEPEDPNGVILAYYYQFSYTTNDADVARTCIRREPNANRTHTHVLKLHYPGNYSFRVQAKSAVGFGAYSPYIYITVAEANKDSARMVGIGLGISILIMFIMLLLYFVLRRYGGFSRKNNVLNPWINPEYGYIRDEWEVSRKKIECMNELGQGSFGMVYEGVARDIRGTSQMRCAIKTINEHATKSEIDGFLCEATRMKKFDTMHVVKLLGVVSEGQPLVIMELMENGDLRSYLRSHRPNADTYDPSPGRQPPTLKQILQMAIEISDGMAYLAAMKYVHRDLAARNCMVADDLTVKIGDFGMTRDIYETDYYRKGSKGLLPVRWMAPESLQDGVFTSSSDVWSYGVVLWEMATLASQPYQGLTNNQVLRYVIDGGIMERPESCPDKLYFLMKRCWRHKPQDRLTFLDLCSLLGDDATTDFSQVSFYHSIAGVEARSHKSAAVAAAAAAANAAAAAQAVAAAAASSAEQHNASCSPADTITPRLEVNGVIMAAAVTPSELLDTLAVTASLISDTPLDEDEEEEEDDDDDDDDDDEDSTKPFRKVRRSGNEFRLSTDDEEDLDGNAGEQGRLRKSSRSRDRPRRRLHMDETRLGGFTMLPPKGGGGGSGGAGNGYVVAARQAGGTSGGGGSMTTTLS